MNKNDLPGYMTAGELAREAGVSLRTLRFYDQKGLLVPAVRGAGNLRYYSEKERERLYEILCYKFMGMSLEEIKSKLEEHSSPMQVGKTIHEKVTETEESIYRQMLQFAIMKDLESLSSEDQKTESWTEYAEVIEYIQAKWEMIWQLNKAIVNGMELSCGPIDGSDEMKQYYLLMKDALEKMNQGVDPESEEMMEIMKRYFDLNPDETLIRVDPDIMKIRGDSASDLWTDIKEYMKKASDYYFENKEA